MDTLIYFVPQSTAFPSGTVRDIAYGGKLIRIIYYSENMNLLSFFRFKRSIRNQIKNCKMFKSNMADKFKNEKIYRDGTSLIREHIEDVVLSVSRDNIVIFSSDVRDLDRLAAVLTQIKNVSVVTLPRLTGEFESVLLENYGIAGAVSPGCRVKGKTVLIMPGGEFFSAAGAENVINMSETDFAAGIHITFNPPKQLKNAGVFIKSPDFLETALCFLGIDYAEARLSSVVFNK